MLNENLDVTRVDLTTIIVQLSGLDHCAIAVLLHSVWTAWHT